MQQTSRDSAADSHLPADPYQKTALIYDEIMGHVEYAKWAHYMIRIFKKHNIVPQSLFDIACGTGSLIKLLDERGFNCLGMDYSRQMIKTAAKKLKKQNIPLITGDMCRVPVNRKFDAILCLYDSMNYLSSLEEVKNCAQSAVHYLNSSGLFIFDLCTEHNCMEYFDGYYQNGMADKYSYVRKSNYNFEQKIQYNDFVIVQSSTGRVFREKHVQHIFPIDEAAELLGQIKNVTLSQYRNMTFRKPDRFAERIHFVLQKE